MSRFNLDPESLQILNRVADRLAAGFDEILPVEELSLDENLDGILQVVADRLGDNYPYHHPLYLGQMLKPPHRLAHLAYTLAMCLNPNNHALDGGRASSAMEKEVVQQIAAMFGWNDALGHLCGGGTIANLEALWVAREMTDGRPIAVSQQAHYTHARCSSLLRMDSVSVAVDCDGRMSITDLERICQQQRIGTVVVTLGTTGLGAVDPLSDVLSLQSQYGFRIHVDAAYGGYYCLVENLSAEASKQFRLISNADSIVVDPHKHGLQPYGCGCVLFKDFAAARVYKHDSPYTYFTSDDLHLGEISLECSRAGAAAVALWATLQRFPLVTGGDFARRLERSRNAALNLFQWIEEHPELVPLTTPDLDVVVWAVRRPTASEASRLARKIFERAADTNLHLALYTAPSELVEPLGSVQEWDRQSLVCLRACVMKPEHLDWMPEILNRLERITNDVLHAADAS